jgi:hypothetical protein
MAGGSILHITGFGFQMELPELSYTEFFRYFRCKSI